MACTSGSVQKVADNTTKAKDQIEKLHVMLMDQEKDNKTFFDSEIQTYLTKANIADGRTISFSSDIKTEYTSEFSLDKIASVVTSALKALVTATDPLVPNPATSPAAISAYTDVVNTVAEAAKSSSTSAASLSFSMTRLSPGMFAFLYASSVNLTDKDTFGSEAITSTAIYYQFVQSIDDLKNETKYGEAVIDANNLIKMKKIQAAYTQQLADGIIDSEVWENKDNAMQVCVDKLEKRLAGDAFKSMAASANGSGSAALATAPSPAAWSSGSQDTRAIVTTAIKKLSTMGSKYAAAATKLQSRIDQNYF